MDGRDHEKRLSPNLRKGNEPIATKLRPRTAVFQRHKVNSHRETLVADPSSSPYLSASHVGGVVYKDIDYTKKGDSRLKPKEALKRNN